MGAVVIGMDPHKRSATIEVMASDETVLDGGRFATDIAGYRAMLVFAKRFEQRTWAVEGCRAIGRHVATGQGRKTDATDAHSIALVGTRMSGLRPVVDDEQLAVLSLLADRRRSLGETTPA